MRLNQLKVGIIDRYIIKKFIGTYFIALLLIILIVIIFDISEKIDNFVDKEAPLKAIVVDYYFNFIPYFMNMFSPLFTFITVIFFTSKLAGNSEIIAILAGGISFRRLMYPYMLSAGIIFVFSLCLNLFVIPKANKTRLIFEEKYVDGKFYNTDKNIHYQISPGQFVYVESFSTWNNTAYKFTLESMKNSRLVTKLSAESAQWDSTRCCWKLKNYILKTYLGDKESVTMGKQMDTSINLDVADFYRTDDSNQALTRKELSAAIKTQRMRGDPMIKYSLIERHNRLSLPFSAFILTLIGVSLSSVKRRGGIGMNLGVGIALSFSYILFMRFSQMFVMTDTLPAAVAIWLPNVLYFFIAIALYQKAPK